MALRFAGTMLLAALQIARSPAQDVYSDFSGTLQKLSGATTQAELNAHWNELVHSKKIPLVAGDSVAFLYRGEAKKVTWMGDFNGWGSNRTFNNAGNRIPKTDVWILKATLPADARLDYKILLNGQQLILDPVNFFNQWSGVGGGSLNSELRMPDWREDPITSNPLPDAPRGNVVRDLLLTSRELGYQVTYNIYTPYEYDDGKAYPVIYVTDGYEYMHERMGNMITTLDNLIHLGKMEPVVAVFIDHREPTNRSQNRRMQELAINEKYFRFITLELLPTVEKRFSPGTAQSSRGIIGTSIGGLSAAWASFSRPDLFSKAGIQSPAFWFKPEIYSLCEQSQVLPRKVFLSTGRIHDAEEGSRRMCGILDSKGCAYQFRVVNQGHSWGNWRDLIDDMLVYLYPADD